MPSDRLRLSMTPEASRASPLMGKEDAELKSDPQYEGQTASVKISNPRLGWKLRPAYSGHQLSWTDVHWTRQPSERGRK